MTHQITVEACDTIDTLNQPNLTLETLKQLGDKVQGLLLLCSPTEVETPMEVWVMSKLYIEIVDKFSSDNILGRFLEGGCSAEDVLNVWDNSEKVF